MRRHHKWRQQVLHVAENLDLGQQFVKIENLLNEMGNSREI